MACAPPPLWPYCAYPEYLEYPEYPSYPEYEYPPPYHMQVVETGFPEFATFSVGEDAERRTVQSWPQKWHVSLYRKYGRTIWGTRSIEYHRCCKNLMTVPRKLVPYKLVLYKLVTNLYLINCKSANSRSGEP